MTDGHNAVPETREVEVLIVGGGPVGLASAFLLGRLGINTELVEKRETAAMQPKGQGVNAATAELFAQWGVLDAIVPYQWSYDRSNGQGLYDSLATGEVAGLSRVEGGADDFVKFYHEISPQTPLLAPSFAYENGLRERAGSWPNVRLSFASEAVDIVQTENDVTASVRHLETGKTVQIRAKYLIAADGNASSIRAALGVEQVIGPDFNQQIVTEFRGDLDPYIKGASYFHFFIGHPKYAGWFGNKQPQTGFWRYNFANPSERTYTDEELADRIRGAVGDPAFEPDIVRSRAYRYSTALTKSWRHGRVFLVGDSAHRHSVWGGFGGNLGLQEANNIAWKLAAVLKGSADDSLLDTYEAERKPRAIYAIKLTTYNTFNMQAIIDVDQFASEDRVGDGGGDFVKEFWKTLRGPLHRATGIEFGAVYESDAVVSDGTTAPKSKADVYVPSASPGARAPHVWLAKDGQRISTIELWQGHFSVLVDGSGREWKDAVVAAASAFGAEIDLHEISADSELAPADGKWRELYKLEAGGAVLVRPDGIVAARFKTLPQDVVGGLGAALAKILGRRRDELASAA